MAQQTVRTKEMKQHTIHEALGKTQAGKMAPIGNTSVHNPHTASRGEDATQQMAETSQGQVSIDPQEDLLTKFNALLTKVLNTTLQQITDKLLKDIREVVYRTAELEAHVEEISVNIASHTKEIDFLKDENLILHAKIEDAENRARRYKGVP